MQIPVIYIQNNGSAGDPDEYGTLGWKIHHSIEPLEGDLVIQKRTPDAFHNTGLNDTLKSLNIKKLIIVGLQTEYCIDTTCRRAYALGYDVTLVKDAHSTWDSPQLAAQEIIDHHNQVLSGWFVNLKRAKEIRF
jgi:nicotinamidase-related amidase